MERKRIPEGENRLLLLYTLDRAGEVTDTQLLQALVDSGEMNYFDMQLGLSELLERGDLVQVSHPLGAMLRLTQSGQALLVALMGRIPLSRRERIDATLSRWQPVFNLERQAPAESIRLADGSPCLCLHLLDGDAPCLDILLPVEDTERLSLLQARWQRAAAAVYRQVLVLLSGDSPAEVLPEGASLAQTGTGDWLLSLNHEGAEAIHLMLRTGTRANALRCAAAWPEAAPALRAAILQTLREIE